MADSLKSQLTKAKQPFVVSEFRDWREKWDKLLERRLPTTLQSELTGSQEGLDYQSADLEDALIKHRAVLMMNPTKFDVQTMDQGATAKRVGSDILKWTARTWQEMNYKRWWDAHVSEGQSRHGVTGFALRWREYKEPDTKSDDAVKALEERDAEMKKRRNPFYLHRCDIYGMYWVGDDPVDGPDVVFYEYEMGYVEAQEKFNSEGKYLSLENAGKLGWLHHDVAPQSDNMPEKKIKVIVRDGRNVDGTMCPLDDDHPARTITTYLCASDNFDEAIEADSYDSPFINSSYYIVGGNILYSASDPHKRYRPLMLPMYVEVAWQNYIRTLLATISRQDYGDEDLAIDPTGAPDWVGPWMAERGFSNNFAKPNAQDGEIAMYPGKLYRIPKQISPHLTALLEESNNHLANYQPNRFLTGNANTEASNATGTAFIQQAQAAGLPYNPLLNESDAAIIMIFKNIFHAMRVWGLTDPPGAPVKYAAIMSGSENLMRGSTSPGDVVDIDATKLTNYDFDLLLRTKSETLAEEGARWLQAKDKYAAGVLPFEALLRESGADDIQGVKDQLFHDRVMAGFQPKLEMLINLTIEHGIAALSGIPIQQLGQPPPAEGGGFQGQAAPTGSGAPLNTPPNSIMGRSIQQAVIQNPDSGGMR